MTNGSIDPDFSATFALFVDVPSIFGDVPYTPAPEPFERPARVVEFRRGYPLRELLEKVAAYVGEAGDPEALDVRYDGEYDDWYATLTYNRPD